MASTNLYAEAVKKFKQDVLEQNKDSDTRRLLNEFLQEGKSSFATSGAAQQAAQDLAARADKKYDGLKFGKVEIVPKSWISAILGNIDKIIDAGSSALSKAPESVGMAWFAISLTLKAISNNYSLYALFGSGLTDITEIMIVIVHYDRLYDERKTPGFKGYDLVEKLFRDTINAYAAVLDFAFSIKLHMSGNTLDKLKHGFKDFFNAQAPKYQGKLDNIALIKGKILESSQGVFQEKTMQQFDFARTAFEEIKQQSDQAVELGNEQKAIMKELLQGFTNIQDLANQPKSPWQVLKDEFLANEKRLNPLPGLDQQISSLLARKYEGTCEWILDNDNYKNWKKLDKNSILCVEGGPGSGKSTLLATLIRQLGPVMNSNGPFINHVSCTGSDNSGMAILGDQNLTRICNTLLYQIYELAAQDEDEISVLATCNQIFRDSDTHKASPKSGRGTQIEGISLFVGAMEKLVAALQRDTILVIDSFETLSRKDQKELGSKLQELIGGTRTSNRIAVLVACDVDSIFMNFPEKNTTRVDLNANNNSDMKLVLDFRLQDLSGWSSTEKQLAKQKVMDQAGYMFNYIDNVAIPFLKQPFQRPVSQYLEKLPKGMNERFERAIRSMPQNYFELLELSLKWCLSAPRPVTVKEVVEAYSKVYVMSEEVDNTTTAMTDDTYDIMATELEKQQISEASGPFLAMERTVGGQTLLKLQDARQIKNFCEHSHEGEDTHTSEGNEKICDKCKSSMMNDSSLAINYKDTHYEIAITLLKHLNNPLFQQRFGLSGGNGKFRAPRPELEPDDSSEKDKLLRLAKLRGVELGGLFEIYGINESTDEATLDKLYTKYYVDVIGGPARTKKSTQPKYRPPPDRFHDDKSDGEDFADFELSQDQPGSESDEVKPSLYNYNPDLRCEINSWPYHLQQAEKLWRSQEQQNNPKWTQYNNDVQRELTKFASNAEVFNNWQTRWSTGRVNTLEKNSVTPLYLAACLGLSTWVKELLDKSANIHELSGGRNVLQASAELSHLHQNVDLLQLLLDRGANAYRCQNWGDLPGLHMWLSACNNFQVIKAFVDHGISFSYSDTVNRWTALHFFAWWGDDVEAFDLIMKPQGHMENPDVNAKDKTKQTPIHKLLLRSNTPINLLKAFLNTEGIEVNCSDKEGRQPLAIASSRGNVDAVRLLLEAEADVANKDRDKGRTALHEAAKGGYADCVQLLLDAQSNVDGKDKQGSTPLHYAAYYGHRDAVEVLISKRGDINSTNDHQRTPLFEATRSTVGGQETALVILRELKKQNYSASQINQVTKGGRTPLRQAAAHGFSGVLAELLDSIKDSNDTEVKAAINKGDNISNRTPLHCAALRGNPKCIQLLVEHGADASREDAYGKTPLVLAIEQWAQRNQRSFEQAVLEFIERDPKSAVANAELPSIAAACGSVDVLEKLHSLDADLNRTDSLGWTPLSHAKESGHKRAAAFLKHATSWGGDLPSRWIDHMQLGVLNATGIEVTYNGKQRICISSNKPLPPTIERFYFEVLLEAIPDNGIVAIGFCTLSAKAHVDILPGWKAPSEASSAVSYGYHSDDGYFFHKGIKHSLTGTDASTSPGETFGQGDTVGCGVDLETRTMWFTKNGTKLGHEFTEVRGRLSPILGLQIPKKEDDDDDDDDEEPLIRLNTNFGREPFVWKYPKLADEDNLP